MVEINNLAKVDGVASQRTTAAAGPRARCCLGHDLPRAVVSVEHIELQQQALGTNSHLPVEIKPPKEVDLNRVPPSAAEHDPKCVRLSGRCKQCRHIVRTVEHSTVVERQRGIKLVHPHTDTVECGHVPAEPADM